MKKILLAMLFALSLEAQEVGAYIEECNNSQEDKLCVILTEAFTKATSAYHKQQFTEAIVLFETLIELAQKNSLEPANFYNNLGLTYHYNNQYDKALELFNRHLAYERNQKKENQERFISIYNNMALVYQAKKEMPKAVEAVKKGLEFTLEEGKASQIAQQYNRVGIMLRANKKYDEAIEYYQKAIDIKLKEIPKDYPLIEAFYSGMAEVYQVSKKYDKALETTDKIIDIEKKIYPKNSPKIILNYTVKGWINFKKKDYNRAIENYKKAQKLGIEKIGSDKLTNVYLAIALTYQGKKELDKAMKFYQKAKEKSIEIEGESHPQTALCYSYIGSYYLAQKKYKEAKENSLKALKVFKKTLPKQHPWVQELLKNMQLINEKYITIYNSKTPAVGKYKEMQKEAMDFVEAFIKHYNQKDDSFFLKAVAHKIEYNDAVDPSLVKKVFQSMRDSNGDIKSHNYLGMKLTRGRVKVEITPEKFEEQTFYKLYFKTKFEKGESSSLQFYFTFRANGEMFFQRFRVANDLVVYEVISK